MAKELQSCDAPINVFEVVAERDKKHLAFNYLLDSMIIRFRFPILLNKNDGYGHLYITIDDIDGRKKATDLFHNYFKTECLIFIKSWPGYFV